MWPRFYFTSDTDSYKHMPRGFYIFLRSWNSHVPLGMGLFHHFKSLYWEWSLSCVISVTQRWTVTNENFKLWEGCLCDEWRNTMFGRKHSEKLVLRNMDYISKWANICLWLLLANRETPFQNPFAMLNCNYVMVTGQCHVTCLILFPRQTC